MSARRLAVVLGFLAVLSLNLGCGKKVFKLVPAKGNITIDGRPVGDLMIQFMPDIDGTSKLPEGPTSFAISDAQGNFELKTYDGSIGAMPGKHLVTVVDQLEERPAQGEQPKNPPRLNSLYSSTASGLSAVVEEGKEIKLTLTNSLKPKSDK